MVEIADSGLALAVSMAVGSASENLEQQKNWLDSIPLPPGRLLDIGCGPGVHLNYFKKRGLEVVGLDRWVDGFQYRCG